MKTYEKDLKKYDVYETSNGNIFVKISKKKAIAIGPKGFHDDGEGFSIVRIEKGKLKVRKINK